MAAHCARFGFSIRLLLISVCPNSSRTSSITSFHRVMMLSRRDWRRFSRWLTSGRPQRRPVRLSSEAQRKRGAERSVVRYAPLSRLGVPALRRRRRLRTVRGWRGGRMRESGDGLLRYPSDDNRSSARGQRQLVLQWRRILRVRAIVISVNVLAARTFAV
jgi:hypothetical protein